MDGRISKRKKFVVGFFLVVLVSVALAFAFLESSPKQGQKFNSELPVQYVQSKSYSSNPEKIQAVVKGSIYETGSNMTVFGACLDGDGYLLPLSVANFSAWYPNGTLLLVNQSMIPDGGGRFRIHVDMTSTVGTYFTEMRCEYAGDYALAFGEWQNPEWVTKIGQTYVAVLGLNTTLAYVSQVVGNMSISLSQFRNDTNQNFTQVLTAINNLNVSVAAQQNYTPYLQDLYNLQRQLDRASWIIDERNPTFSIGSGMNHYTAVDVADVRHVAVAGRDGVYGYWDGDLWNFGQVANVTWYGVAALAGPLQFNVYAGRRGPGADVAIFFNATGGPVYSINGGVPETINEGWFNATNTTVFTDVKTYFSSNSPSNPIEIVLFGDSGILVKSNNQGLNWSNLGSTGFAGKGRISPILRTNPVGEDPGYVFAVVGETGVIGVYNGTSLALTNISARLKDVSVLNTGQYVIAYLVGENSTTNRSVVYTLISNTLNEVYEAQENVNFRAVSAIAVDDVWVATGDPSVYYHFDGRSWEYEVFAYSNTSGIFITFQNGSTDPVGLKDMSMKDGVVGYAVGGDGLIMKLQPLWDSRFDEILANLNVSSADFSALINITLSMNQSLNARLDGVQNTLDQMNASIDARLTTIESNVTYTNMYLNTTIQPMLASILVSLGIIEANVNQTLAIVNATQQNVSFLVEQARRPRAWATT